MRQNASISGALKKPSEYDRVVLSRSRTTSTYKSWICTNHENVQIMNMRWNDFIPSSLMLRKASHCIDVCRAQHWPTPRQALDLCLPARKKILCLGLLFWLGLGTQEADWPCCPCSLQTAATYTNKVWPSTSVNNAVIACCHSNTRMSPAPFLPWLLPLEFQPAAFMPWCAMKLPIYSDTSGTLCNRGTPKIPETRPRSVYNLRFKGETA